ncbi:MAG: cyclic nucleotide-binding domain-containing protein [Nocardioidaceae bacterium]
MAADPRIVDELGSTDLFAGIRRKALKAIASYAHVVSHAPGEEVTEEGRRGLGFHLIREGTATVTVGGHDRRSLGPGEYFGEISLIDGLPRSATVRAATPLTTIALTSWTFLPLLDEYPEVSKRLLEVMCARLRAVEQSER